MPRVKRILVPTDFSTPSNLAVNYAIEMAYRFGATVHLLHAVESAALTTYPDGFFAEPVALRQQRREDAERQLTDAAARCQAARVRVTLRVVDGPPAASIIDEATMIGADLIVMGTQGRRGVAHLLLGSVAERVVRSAPCAVLTVRDTMHVVDVLNAGEAKCELALA
jgi:universal stress protein A